MTDRRGGSFEFEVTVPIKVVGYVTVDELADVSGIPAATIRYHCRESQGQLYGRARKTGRDWIIPAADADAFAAAYSPYSSLRKPAPDTPPASGAEPTSQRQPLSQE